MFLHIPASFPAKQGIPGPEGLEEPERAEQAERWRIPTREEQQAQRATIS
jgi:hypothetical protein